MHRLLITLCLTVAGGVVIAACGGPPDTSYGPPNGISGKTPPEPSSTSTSGPGSHADGGSGTQPPAGGDSGAPPTGGMDSGGGPQPSNCSVKWSTQVFPLFKAAGAGQCASGACHGGSATPTILDGDSAATYATLTGYTINGKPYIATTGAPADSTIECNLGIAGATCGIAKMPASPGILGSTELQTINNWLKCGAPQN
jgi:hypothetical protein